MEQQKLPNYQWQADAKFEITGMQMQFIMNTLHRTLSTPEAQQTMALVQVMGFMEQALHKGFEQGIVVDANAVVPDQGTPDPASAPTKEVDLAVEG